MSKESKTRASNDCFLSLGVRVFQKLVSSLLGGVKVVAKEEPNRDFKFLCSVHINPIRNVLGNLFSFNGINDLK